MTERIWLMLFSFPFREEMGRVARLSAEQPDRLVFAETGGGGGAQNSPYSYAY